LFTFINVFCPSFAAIEFSERLSYFGIATSLVIYLTKVLHQDLKTAVKNVNYWSGVTTLMPLLGGFLADAYLGRYTTVITSCIVYLMVINLSHHSTKHFITGEKIVIYRYYHLITNYIA